MTGLGTLCCPGFLKFNQAWISRQVGVRCCWHMLKHLLVSEKDTFPAELYVCWSCSTVAMSCSIFGDKSSISNKWNCSQFCRKNHFLKKRQFWRVKNAQKYGKIKYTLLFLLEKIVPGYICQIQSVCQKVEESGRAYAQQFHLSSVFLFCIYLASENAGNVFSFRLGPSS